MIIKRLVIFLCILFVNSKRGGDDVVGNTIDDKGNVSEIGVEITGNRTDDSRNYTIVGTGNSNVTDDNRSRNTSVTITNSGVKTIDSMMILCLFSLFL